MNVKRPASLTKGDKIGIVAPARKMNKKELEPALSIIQQFGFEPYYEPKLFDADRQFAGTDETRTACFQELLDNPEIKAIVSARGGYGSVRIIDKIDFNSFTKNPKWIIGYSDVTVFHNHINRNCDVQTLHASMPINFEKNSDLALSGLFNVLQGNSPSYTIQDHPLNRNGSASALLTGGNLSVLYSLLGSKSFPKTKGKILFIEDLDEYLYHIDRMMVGLARAGVFEGLAGMIIGGMTDMNDNEVPFGKSAEEIVLETVMPYNFPVCFGFPAGHIDDNRPLIMGSEVEMHVGDDVTLKFLH